MISKPRLSKDIREKRQKKNKYSEGKSELDRHLEKAIEKFYKNFDTINWQKVNFSRFSLFVLWH